MDTYNIQHKFCPVTLVNNNFRTQDNEVSELLLVHQSNPVFVFSLAGCLFFAALVAFIV